MKRKYVYIALCAMLSLSLNTIAQNPAKGWSFDAGIGAGYSALGYKVNANDNLHANTIGSYGLHAHLGANYFFLDYLGIGIGADFTRYGNTVGLNGTMTWQDVTDTDGEKYNHTLAIQGWQEQQQQWFIAPNVLLHAAISVQRIRIWISAGVEYAFCLSSSYQASGTLTHTGYYPFGNLTLHDLPEYGFYTTDALRPYGKQNTPAQQLSVVGKVGIAIPVAQGLDITAHILAKYAVYGSNSLHMPTEKLPLGFHENQLPDTDPHDFIPEYVPLATTSVVAGNPSPLYVGLEIGIRYTISKRRLSPCMCIDY